tara:strand:+ start:413 stop:718 length:306 start_codon:yes stop_codon:yes gene_type:complete
MTIAKNTNDNGFAALELQQNMEARIAELEAAAAELKALKAEAKKMLRLKVSQKGAVSVYGLNSRFPLTLYANQWERLIEEVISSGQMSAFIDANNAELARK